MDLEVSGRIKGAELAKIAECMYQSFLTDVKQVLKIYSILNL